MGHAIPAYLPLLLAVAVILLPLVDFVWAVLRRLARGQSPFHADAGHLHHRVLHRAQSHVVAVLILYMWAVIFSFTCVLLVALPSRDVLMIGAGAVLVGTGITVAVFRGAARVYHRRVDATTSDPFVTGGAA